MDTSKSPGNSRGLCLFVFRILPLRRLHPLDHRSELTDLSDDVFVPAFYVLDVGDVGIPRGYESGYDHGDSGPQIPAGDGRTPEVGRSEYKGFVRVHKCGMPLHLIKLYKEVQPRFEHDLLNPGNPLGLSQKNPEYGLEISGKSWKDIGLELHGPQVFGSIDPERIIAEILESDSCLLALHEETCQVMNPGIFNVNIILARKCPKNHKCSRFDVIMDYICSKYLIDLKGFALYRNGVVMMKCDIRPHRLERFYEIDNMWFNRGESDDGISRTPNIGDYHIFCGSDRKIRSTFYIVRARLPGYTDIFPVEIHLVSHRPKAIQMLINTAFPEITPSWIGHLHFSKSCEQRGDKHNPDPNLADQRAIQGFEGHVLRIHPDDALLEGHLHSQTGDDGEKCTDVPDIRNILYFRFLPEERRRDDFEGSILRSANLDGSGNFLSTGNFEHILSFWK